MKWQSKSSQLHVDRCTREADVECCLEGINGRRISEVKEWCIQLVSCGDVLFFQPIVGCSLTYIFTHKPCPSRHLKQLFTVWGSQVQICSTRVLRKREGDVREWEDSVVLMNMNTIRWTRMRVNCFWWVGWRQHCVRRICRCRMWDWGVSRWNIGNRVLHHFQMLWWFWWRLSW